MIITTFLLPSFKTSLAVSLNKHHCVGDVAWLSSHYMSNPSSSPLHDDGAHAVLVAVAEKMLVGDGLRPEYLQDSCT